MGIEAILLLVAQYLPELLATAPKIGLAIHNIFGQNADALPDQVKAALADVKLRQAVEDAAWRADLPGTDAAALTSPAEAGVEAMPGPAGSAADALAATVKDQAAELLRLSAENQRLANLLAAEQAALPPSAAGGDDLPPGPPEP